MIAPPTDWPTSGARPRHIQLQGHSVPYGLRRSTRRSIGFVVGSDGLRVSAPRWVRVGDIEAALQEKADWILRKLAEQQERQRRLQATRIEWCDGASVPFLGESVVLVIDPRQAGVEGGAVLYPAQGEQQGLQGVPQQTLHLGLPLNASSERIRDVVHSWLQRQARQIFETRCRHYATQLGVRYTRLSLSNAQTRWGSASADGAIRLHWRLVHFGLPIIDYVVAHELAHLREMNHSPRFWEVVRSVLPDYEQARRHLRHDALPQMD